MSDATNATLIVTEQDTLISELNKASSAEACLIVVRGQQPGKRYELSGPVMRIGRDSSSDIIIDDPKVSRQQAKLIKERTSVLLVDGGSTNGTFVNDLRIDANTPQQLGPGDRLRLAANREVELRWN